MVKHRAQLFTLNPLAQRVIDRVKKNKKSAFVSQALVWYDKPRDFITDEYGMIRRLNLADLVASRDRLQAIVLEQADEIKELKKMKKWWRR